MFLFMLTPGFLLFALVYLVIGYAYALYLVKRTRSVSFVGSLHPLDHLKIFFVTFAWPFVLVKKLFS